MLAIFKREFKAYFQSVIGWLFIAATLSVFGLYFYVYNLMNGYPTVSSTLSAITFIFLITVPVLTMRILAEERKNKTDQMILTAPVSVEKIVAAKYLAMAAIFTIVVAVIAITPIILSFFGTVPFAENYVGILGFWLYGLTCIAIGMFISSLTESQVIAAVITFAALFLGFMMHSITGLISSTGNAITKILNCYDLTSSLDNFFAGMFDLAGLIYYITLIMLFLFLTVQSIQKRRWSMSSKKIKLGVFSSGMVVIGIALTVVVNLAVSSLPSTITAFDVTSAKLYSITDDTKDVLANLEDDITIYVLAAESSGDTTVAKTLERYEDESSHISVVYKDPSVYPNFYTNYTDDSSLTSNSIIVESSKRSKVIDYNDLFETSVDYTTYTTNTTGYDGEGQITSAIQYVSSDDMPVIYELEGHDETAISGNFSSAVEKANITLTSINLLKYDAIPDDAAAIIINGPTSDFSSDDADKVISYLQGGGKAFIATNYTDADMSNFYSILSAYGLTIADGMVIEGSTNNYYQQPYYLLPNIESAKLTSSIGSNYIFAPYAQGMTYATDGSDDITYTPLLSTSDSAFAKADIANMTSYDKEDGDVDGPFTIGVDVTATVDDDTTTELTVFSCSSIFADNADEVVSGQNSTLFTDVITNLAGESDTSSVVIAVKEYDASTLTVSQTIIILGAVFGIIVIPLALIILGIIVWVRRRKR